jgi:hypothetical protein
LSIQNGSITRCASIARARIEGSGKADLHAGGFFTTAGGKVSAYIAKARIGSAANSIPAFGSSATIQFSGVVGYEYHVQRTDTLTPPMTWTTLTTNPLSPANDGSLAFTDTTAPPGTAYYRLLHLGRNKLHPQVCQLTSL